MPHPRSTQNKTFMATYYSTRIAEHRGYLEHVFQKLKHDERLVAVIYDCSKIEHSPRYKFQTIWSPSVMPSSLDDGYATVEEAKHFLFLTIEKNTGDRMPESLVVTLAKA